MRMMDAYDLSGAINNLSRIDFESSDARKSKSLELLSSLSLSLSGIAIIRLPDTNDL